MKKGNNTRNCETAIEIASESDTESDTAQKTCVQNLTETHCSKTAIDIDTVSNRGTHLHRSPTTGRIQRLPYTDNHNKATTSQTSSALFSSDKDLIGIFTNPSSNKSNSLINQGSSQKVNTPQMHDYQIIPLLLKAGILAQPETITLQTTSAQCIINFVCLTMILITVSRRLLSRIVLHFKNRVMLNRSLWETRRT